MSSGGSGPTAKSGVGEAIVLAGGRGTRLQGVIGDIPKPLAQVAGRPFLCWLLDWLEASGLKRILLSVGYRGEAIRTAIGTSYNSLNVEYLLEPQPLGTGGALAFALGHCASERVLCLNGDTYFDVDVEQMATATVGADVAIALREIDDVSRYGAVSRESGRVVGFEEKGRRGPGYINGGMYIIARETVLRALPKGSFSFESDFLAGNLSSLNVQGYESPGYFIDIGVPTSLQQAQSDFKIIKAKRDGCSKS